MVFLEVFTTHWTSACVNYLNKGVFEKSMALSKKQINILLREKENLFLEFKTAFSSKLDEDIVAFSNTKGGTIIVGVEDNGNIKGAKLTNEIKAKINVLCRNCSPPIETQIMELNNVFAIEISEGRNKPYCCSSGYFRRLDGNTQKMNTDELKMLFADSDKIPFEEKANTQICVDDISVKKVEPPQP